MDFRFDRLMALAHERFGITKAGTLAAQADVDRSILHRLEKGQQKSVSGETATRLANYLGCSVDYLWGLTDDPTPSGEVVPIDVAWLVKEISDLSFWRRKELSEYVDMLKRNDVDYEQQRELIMKVFDALLTPDESSTINLALAALRDGDVALASRLIDGFVAGINDAQPLDQGTQGTV